MRLSILLAFFQNEISLQDFKTSIEHEITEYEKRMKTIGSSININIIEDTPFTFSLENAKQLKNYFSLKQLNVYEILFIADWLILSESINYENDQLNELIEDLSNLDTKRQI